MDSIQSTQNIKVIFKGEIQEYKKKIEDLKSISLIENEVKAYMKRLSQLEKKNEMSSNKIFLTKENSKNKVLEKINRQQLLDYFLISYQEFKETNDRLFRQTQQRKVKAKKVNRQKNDEILQLWKHTQPQGLQ